ncbi:zinc finger protein 652-B-like [Aedes albopictus]|uniref:C2h2-type zn-finger protein n=1 Tax=Aedes albopictus TaxID=7160 RepID=A0ABM1Z790_AEDAL|nr:zinc finger protein 652-B-like [Aedes albopictus]
MTIFKLERFPHVCRTCLQPKTAAKPMTELNEHSSIEPDTKLDDVLDDFTFPVPADLKHLIPSAICDRCLEQLNQFLAYRKRLNYLLKFMFGLALVKRADTSALEELFKEKDYVLALLKELNVLEGDVEVGLNELLEEFPQYDIDSMPDVKNEGRDGVDSSIREVMESALIKVEVDDTGMIVEYLESAVKRRRGRPKAIKKEDKPKRKPGRPKKATDESDEDDQPLKRLKLEALKASQGGEITGEEEHLVLDENDMIEERLSNASEHFADQDLSEMLENTDEHIQDLDDDDSEGDFQLDESLVRPSKPRNKHGKRSPPKSERRSELMHCDKCKFKTYYPHTYDLHMDKHYRREMYPNLQRCKRCDLHFESKKELDKHKRLEHRDFMCDTCGLSFEQKFALETHRKRHESVRQFKCEYCPMEYYTRPEMLLHVKQAHLNAFEVKCPDCGLSFKTKSTLNQHVKTHTNQRTHTCSVCGYGFKSYTHLNRHVKSVHQDVRFKCDHCEISYGRKDKLRMHMEKTHNIQTYFVCDICLQSYNSKDKLDDHKVHHENPKPLQCGVCLAAHVTQEEFEQHLCITYKDSYVCCNRDFKYHFYYNKHMFLAHGMKTNVRVKPTGGLLLGQVRALRKQAERCPRCEQEFATRNLKKQHMLSCRGPNTAATTTSIGETSDTAEGAGSVVSVQPPVPPTTTTAGVETTYEIEYIDNYDPDEDGETMQRLEIV